MSIINYDVTALIDNSKFSKALEAKASKIFVKQIDKILFVNPPESSKEDFNIPLAQSKRYPSYPPYGAGILSSNLKLRGYKAKIIDLNFFTLKNVHLDNNFEYDKWINYLKNEINLYKPDIINISLMFTMVMPSAKRVVEVIKSTYPDLPIFAGGIAVSNDIENFLREFPDVAFAGIYEGDVSFPDFIDYLNGKVKEDKVKQIGFLEDGNLYLNSNRSTPNEQTIGVMPDYGDLPIGEYSMYGALGAYNFLRNPNEAASTIISNRGCRARCSFCAVRNFNGLRVRSRSVESVVDEMEHHKEKYGIKHFMWLDDDLLKDEERIISLFKEIADRNLDITWDATNGLIAAAFTEEIMDAAVKSGCIGFNLGLESGNDEILRQIHKPGNVKSYKKAKEIFSKYPHIFIKGFTILGFPNETISQINNTIKVFQELEFHWYPLQLLTPLAGTEIAFQMVEQGLIAPSKETSFRGSAAGSKSRSGGTLRQREIAEKHNAREFVNLLETLSENHVPTQKELDEIWFIADYKLNYEKILKIQNHAKLKTIKLMLTQITDEYTFDNAMGNLFLGHIERVLGNLFESERRFQLAEKLRDESEYWKKRFSILGMNKIF